PEGARGSDVPSRGVRLRPGAPGRSHFLRDTARIHHVGAGGQVWVGAPASPHYSLDLGAFLGGGVMTKAEIVQAVYDRLGGFSKKEAAELVDLVFELMKETLGHGEKIKVSGFGNFVLRDKRKRQGRNPQTGEPIEITERRVLNFKASQILKQVLNQDRPPARPVGEAATSG